MAMAMLAVVIRILIPPGFMVAPSMETGGSRIVICSPQGAVEVLIDASGHRVKTPTDHDNSKGGAHPCAFASVAIATLASDQASDSTATVYADRALGNPTPTQRPGLGLAAPPPPKTGPPILI